MTERGWAPGTTFAAALAEAASLTDAALDKLIAVPAGLESRVFEAMRYAVLAPGKRLRPFLVLAGSQLFAVSRRSALQVAAAIELVHAYSLVHDDLPAMDNSELRRGRPTCHKAFDDATAILAGDGLLTLAFEVLAHTDTHGDPAVRCELVAALAQAAGSHGRSVARTARPRPMRESSSSARRRKSPCSISSRRFALTPARTSSSAVLTPIRTSARTRMEFLELIKLRSAVPGVRQGAPEGPAVRG